MRRFVAVFFDLLFSLIASVATVRADVGPENVLLIVNPKSRDSLCIANHYARLRRIPDDQMVFVPWDPKEETADVDAFRKKILEPIVQTIYRRRLAGQIAAVVYSSDFPWGIRLDSDIHKFSEPSAAGGNDKKDDGGKPAGVQRAWPQVFTPVGALTGLTYLWQPVLANSPAYFALDSNAYMRPSATPSSDQPSLGFRADRHFDALGDVVAGHGRGYLLSVMLGVTAGRGNTLDEVLAYLERSAKADGTHPKGTIYFMKNGDIRSTVRDRQFPTAVEELKRLGVNALMLNGVLPEKQYDVQGLVVGAASFDWRASGSAIRPGAICEHFTSFGGMMSRGAAQTPLSEFLRYGAAGASGTVCEPYAIANKFPSPMIQVHYARGCTLAEAFYQSVRCPYQLLIVGDPLCRPWADIPRVSAEGVVSGGTLSGECTIRPAATFSQKASASAAVEQFELFFDGVRLSTCKPDATFSLDTKKLPDGWHEIRIVATGSLPLETQGELIAPVCLANYGRTAEATLDGQAPWRADRPMTLDVRSPGVKVIAAFQGDRVIGRLEGDHGQIRIPADTFGPGPVRIRVAAIGADGPSTHAMAKPIEINVE